MAFILPRSRTSACLFAIIPNSASIDNPTTSVTGPSASTPGRRALRARQGRERPARRGFVSLKLDDRALRVPALETLCWTVRAVRTSSLWSISRRHHRISPTGAVALALMIRDYPDVLNAHTSGKSPIAIC
ncbi:hypothetical protein B0H17DRAFT_1190311 [Mycena rosella]|uniref:Uncharacterized protein n=1 Tax=Mycena rosella TaxID=1033263 RepID=A0AAD7MCH5_MYCRO|nr:hypothetical protein B0H17DRAFT_1190311 [Mycena rosella]